MSRRYLQALGARLKGGPRKPVRPAARLGRAALASGLETLDLARMHEQAVLALTPEDCSPRLLGRIRKQSGLFFLEALAPIEDGNRRLKQEIVQRKAAETALIKSEQHQRVLLMRSRQMEQRLRHLSHQILSAQEEERKKISRELHDHIAQTLAGINVHLATLQGADSLSRLNLDRRIRNTHRIVEKSVGEIHRFARELRPPVLDDIGLIPALQSFLTAFTKRTGVLAHLTVFAGIEQLHSDRRTVLYRVAAEGLTNVAKHAKATRVTLTLVQVGESVRMHLHDDGKSFDVERVLWSRTRRRIGVLGMRERVEMVGGRFHLSSAPDRGTTLEVQIPFRAGGKLSLE